MPESVFARDAGVPIQIAYFDYAKKEMGIKALFYPTNDEQADLAKIQEYYKDISTTAPEEFSRKFTI